MNGGKKHKSEPKRLRFVRETTYGKVLSGQDEIETFLAYLRGDRSDSSPWRYPDDEFVQQPVAQITWYRHIALMDKVKNADEHIWYAEQVAKNGWSRNVLVHQIESGLYQRQGRWVVSAAHIGCTVLTNVTFSRYTSNSYKAIDRPLG